MELTPVTKRLAPDDVFDQLVTSVVTVVGVPLRTFSMQVTHPPSGGVTFVPSASMGANGEIPDVTQMRIPVQYLANLLTAGDNGPVIRALERMLAMRAWQRGKHVDNVDNAKVLDQVGLTRAQVEDMYHVMAIANYEDRFVIPTSHREWSEDAQDMRGSCGFSFGNGCSGGSTETNLFGTKQTKRPTNPMEIA